MAAVIKCYHGAIEKSDGFRLADLGEFTGAVFEWKNGYLALKGLPICLMRKP